MSPSTSLVQAKAQYSTSQTAGVTFIAITALTSFLSIFYLFIFRRPKAKTFRANHLFGYFMCLLVANVIQTVGTLIDFEWIGRRGVVDGFSCSLQGGLKQAGNLSASFWSLIISLHVFLLLFFQIRSNRATFIMVIIATWSVVLLIVLVGRFVIQNKSVKGPYYGIAGGWCWITKNYQTERIFLECAFSLLTIAISFTLYSAIFLHVRGNIIVDKNRTWSFKRTVASASLRNLTTSNSGSFLNGTMLEIAKKMSWYPVSYTALMLPMTLVRILEFKYAVPFSLTIIAGVVFNSMGLINVILVIYITRVFKQLDDATLPHTSVGRGQRGGSMDKLRSPSHQALNASPNLDNDKYACDPSQVPIITVDLPKEPAGTYVAPDSWKTSSPAGRQR